MKGVEEVLLTPNGEFNGEAHAVSADGNTIVGGNYALGDYAWIWQPQIGGVRPISGKGSLTALDVSDDGNVVVGFSSPVRALLFASLPRQKKPSISSRF